MSITNHIIPATYSAGYSLVPLRSTSTNVTVDEFNYLVTLLYNEIGITSLTIKTFKSFTYTEILTDTDHPYKLGDVIFLEDFSADYTGFFTIVKITDTDKFIINLTLGAAYSGPGNTYNNIKYKPRPDLEDAVRIDFSNTLKDFVTENLEDVPIVFDGSDTKLVIKYMVGEEFNYVFNFEDNFIATGGFIGFFNTGITQSSDVLFQVGDEIIVQQDLFEWTYTDMFNEFTKLGITSSNIHNFRIGQQVTVTGQTLRPSNNGVTTVLDDGPGTGNANWLVVDKLYGTIFLPPETGLVTGTPFPEYNTTCVVTDITVGATGAFITTDNDAVASSQPISGDIKLTSITTDIDKFVSDEISVYNARQETLKYTIDGFDPYVIQSRDDRLNNISTILGTTSQYRIESNTKSWLLSHQAGTTLGFKPHYYMYDSSDVLLGHYTLDNISGNVEDWYFPVGLDQLSEAELLSPAQGGMNIISGSTFSTIKSQVDHYEVASGNATVEKTNKITFFLNKDCSMFDVYHIMWKDARGSWLSYPFKYISRDRTEVERKNFYKTEENWGTTTVGYDTFGRGEKSYFTRSRDKVELTSGWVEEYENVLIKDMLQSASQFIQLPDGTLVAAIIENKDIVFGEILEDQIWNYKFKARFSRNEVRF